MKKLFFLAVTTCLLFLNGCLFPDDQRAENRLAYPDQLQSVQHAVDQFQTDTGVLPIRTFDQNTSLYQRYIIDFNQLVPRYLQQPPGTAFENGGVFQYVLVNVEEAPEIKVIDLTSQRQIQQFQQKLNDYMRKNRFAPIDEMVDVGLFKLDYEALNYKEAPHVRSPYHDTYLPLLLTNDGEIIIDYRIDLNMMLQEKDHSFEEGEDIRSLLYEDTPFVPFRSVPYVLDDNGEPAYAMELR
ncbi:ABC transporter periplasmic binding protein yphF [Halalkalibacter wakoensis JCM 9140]|uniref:ABC transporter periplasmic binding protein yphF n=1 Tax=Halalkalibacter wakoensis JCM 9140 TaxID=1236970 RepID=W4PZ30_9BACI|nr:hypothetical protein [Halalkalibacter wakoensis]GAE25091.1 ABC transporter periplasmic binding protein yphF [Halalkalibacter wakoensis JCM 9140]